jgi:hypothetical protein
MSQWGGAGRLFLFGSGFSLSKISASAPPLALDPATALVPTIFSIYLEKILQFLSFPKIVTLFTGTANHQIKTVLLNTVNSYDFCHF